jgi:hypothetical protein
MSIAQLARILMRLEVLVAGYLLPLVSLRADPRNSGISINFSYAVNVCVPAHIPHINWLEFAKFGKGYCYHGGSDIGDLDLFAKTQALRTW